MNKKLYNKNYDFNVKKNTPKIFKNKIKKIVNKPLTYINNDTGKTRHFTPAVQEWFNSIYAYDHNYIKSLPVADKYLMNTSLKFSFKTILNIFSIKSVIESIFLLLFILHVFSLDIDGLLILINSILIANFLTKLNAGLNSYKNKNVFLKNLLNYLKILDSLFNKYLMIKGLCPLNQFNLFFI